jgi:CTP synthase (UTP-ammonia lyase)
LGIKDAQHEETAPNASILFISLLACSLVGKRQIINIQPGSISHKAYAKEEVDEQFVCNYGLNPQFRNQIKNSRLQITGVDENDEVRVVELNDHPFFIATLHQPQISSHPSNPHPLIMAYVKAALACKEKM